MIKAAIVAVSCMWGVAAFAQPAGSLVQVPNIQFFDTSSGSAVPLSGGKVYTYLAGTTTPSATYADSALTTPNTNPITLNSNGYNAAGSGNAGVWLGVRCYKIVLKTAALVTIYTQDNVCNDYGLLKASINAATGAGVIGFSQTSTYPAASVGLKLQNYISVRDAPYNAVGDGTADDTIAVQGAMDKAVTTGKMLYFPSGNYAVSSINETTATPLVLYCDGPHTSIIKRHSGSLQASYPLLKVLNSTNLTIRNCGWNELGDGSNFTNNASTVWIENVASSDVDNNYSIYGQSNAFIYIGSNNVSFTNNEIDHQWNVGIALSGMGNVSSPIYANRITIANNKINETPFGILVTIFVKNDSVTGNSLTNSSIALVQDVRYSTVTGNSIIGSATYGNPVGPFDGIFLEGITDFTVSDNFVKNVTKNGIFCQGSQLSVGSTEQLPIARGLMAGNVVINSSSTGISVIGASFDHTLKGVDWSVKSNLIMETQNGITAASSDGFDVTDNTILRSRTNGIELSVVKNGYLKGNIIRDSSQLTANTYHGIIIGNDPPTDTKDLYIYNNTISDTTSHMRCGVNDDALGTGGWADAVRHWGNTISGGAIACAWAPDPAIPTIGGFIKGDRIENFGGPNGATEWIATATGIPGTWAAVGWSTSEDCVTLASPEHCGTSASGIGVVLPTTSTITVESTAVTASNAILITADDSLGAAIGVTCDTTNIGMKVSTRVAGAYFTITTSAAPTGYKCFSWRIKQQ